MTKLLPPRPFLDAIAVRVALLWVFLHGVASLGLSSGGGGAAGSPMGSPVTALILIPSIVLAMRIEMGRRSELVFLANLGYSFGRIAAVIIIECLIFEMTFRLIIV